MCHLYWTNPSLQPSSRVLTKQHHACQHTNTHTTATPITLSVAAAKDSIHLTKSSLPSPHTFASPAVRPPFPWYSDFFPRLFVLTPGPHTHARQCSSCGGGQSWEQFKGSYVRSPGQRLADAHAWTRDANQRGVIINLGCDHESSETGT